ATDCLCSVEPVAMDDDAAQRHMQVLEALEIVRDPAAPLADRAAALAVCLSLGHRGRVGRKQSWSQRPSDLQRVREGLRALGELRDHCKEQGLQFPPLEDAATAELAAAVCAEAGAAARAYTEAKRRRCALDFADLQILARDLLVAHPHVLERVRGRYDFVLVDEFQDTNRLQKQILWLIAGGDTDSGQLPPAGKLFVVGDAKQSIYGFRSADVTVFNATLREFDCGGEGCEVLRLEQSRRSRPELVAFHNALFCHECVMGLMRGEEFEATYEPLGAVRQGPALPHDVELLLVSSQAEEEGEDALSAHEARIREAEALAARIRALVEGAQITVEAAEDEGGTRVPRPARYGDFGMLFQSMTSVGVYEYALRREGIPFYTVAGRGFYHRQEIRDVVSLLRVLENASDSLSLVGALRSPMFALSDEAIFWLTRGSGPLWAALSAAAQGRHPHQQHLPAEQLERIRRAQQVIGGLRADRDRLSLSELVEGVLARTGLAALHLSQFAGRQAVANLRKLTDLARSFEQTGEFSLREFIAWLDELLVTEQHEGLASVHEEAADVVQLLTVHKAKGLEWPIVVVPDLTRDPGPRGRPDPLISADLGPVPKMELPDGTLTWGAVGCAVKREEEARETAERRRLLYVALTRARDHLILSSSYAIRTDRQTKQPTLAAGLWLQWLTTALGIDPLTIADGTRLSPDGSWSCLISRPAAEEPPRAAPRPERAAPTIIDRALAAAPSGLPAELPPLVRPVRVGAQLPARFTVSALQRYRTCPHLYYLRDVLGMPEQVARERWLDALSAVERGEMVHRALAAIGREGLAQPGAIEEAIAFATSPAGLVARMDEEDRERLAASLRWFVHEACPNGDGEPLYRTWVAEAHRLRTEVAFLVPMGEALIEGTIDALAEDSAGNGRILDYKTGGEPLEEQLEGYRFQVGLYCAAVEALTGRAPEDAALVLLDARRVVRIDPRPSAQWALAAAREIAAAVRAQSYPAPERCQRDHCALAYACDIP
ncbi:MAG: UvrD-helicase domain-containing protein, partial [Armatimonadota bacterium]